MKDIKVILFDIDGVLIRLPHFFSKEMELKGYRGAEECLNVYYAGHKHLSSLEGMEDHKEQILHASKGSNSFKTVSGVNNVIWPCIFVHLSISSKYLQVFYGFLTLLLSNRIILRDLDWLCNIFCACQNWCEPYMFIGIKRILS